MYPSDKNIKLGLDNSKLHVYFNATSDFENPKIVKNCLCVVLVNIFEILLHFQKCHGRPSSILITL